MAYSLVRSTVSGALAGPQTIAFGGTPTAGNLLIASVYSTAAVGTAVVSDSNSNWTLLASNTLSSRTLSIHGKIADASQPTSISATESTNAQAMNIYEFTGGQMKSTTGLNIIMDGNTTGTSAASTAGDIATIVGAFGPDGIIFAQVGVNTGSVTAPTCSDGTFTQGQAGPASPNIRLMDWYKLSSAVGTTYNPTLGWTTSRSFDTMITSLAFDRRGFF